MKQNFKEKALGKSQLMRGRQEEKPSVVLDTCLWGRSHRVETAEVSSSQEALELFPKLGDQSTGCFVQISRPELGLDDSWRAF